MGKFLLLSLACLAVLALPQAVMSEIVWEDMGAPPNEGPVALPAGIPLPVDTSLPGGYLILNTFPNLWWSGNCIGTNAAGTLGYLSNSGFPLICRISATNEPYLFPFGDYPNDNRMFMLPTDPLGTYVSKCDLSASQAGVFGRDSTNKGHIDDYCWGYPNVGSGYDPYKNSTPTWEPHVDDCICDFIGASVRWYRNNMDGDSSLFFDSNGPACRWVPLTYDTTAKTFTNIYRPLPQSSTIDSMYGIAQYIAVRGGYYSTTSYALDSTPFNDVYMYGNRYIKGVKCAGWGFGPVTEGADKWVVINELEAGWPVYLYAVGVTTAAAPTGNIGKKHAIIAYGYNKAEIDANPNAQLKLLTHDTWNEYWLSSDFLKNPYRIVAFPTESEAGDTTSHSFQRKSRGEQWWKLYGIGMMRVNNNPRCPAPLPANESPSGVYDEPFDIQFDLGTGGDVYHIHYGGREPNPNSPSFTLDANGQATFPITQDCGAAFRTYRDAAAPNGYLASQTVYRYYSVFSTNKNVKKLADGEAMTMVNGIVTFVVDSNNFYYEERDKRLFGIKVQAINDGMGHGMAVGDEVLIVNGVIRTDSSNSERYVEATDFIKQSTPSTEIKPFGMSNKLLGGKTYDPPGSTGTGHGQLGASGTGSTAVNNVGMLVRAWGKVSYIGNDYITVSDGATIQDREGNTGVKIYGPGIPTGLVANRSIVSATGICSLERGISPDDDLYPIVRLRTSDQTPEIEVIVP